MKIFITGVTGYIGNHVAKSLRREGHEVFGLTRKKNQMLFQEEIIPLEGNLDQIPEKAKEMDVIIHAAFESVEKDLELIPKLLSFEPKIFLYTSGVWVYGNRKEPLDESSPLSPLPNVSLRPKAEKLVLESSTTSSYVIRPGHVYGYDRGLFSMVLKDPTFIGSGENFWTAVHVEDLANLYQLIMEKRPKLQIFNAVQKSYQIKEIAQKIAQLSRKKETYLSLSEGIEKFGLKAHGLAVNQPHIESKHSKEIGWSPKHKGFLEELELYYHAAQSRDRGY